MAFHEFHATVARSCLLATALCLIPAGVRLDAASGVIVDQQLDASGQGHTVIRVWGSHYEMGYAHGVLLGDHIVQAVAEVRALITEPVYPQVRGLVAAAVWRPAEIEEELDGMVDGLAESHPEAGIDKLDLKVFNALGDWSYACRSHMCWGRYAAPPVRTLATRRLDLPTPVSIAHHHVLCAWDPDDGSPRWVNLAWPGYVAVVTGVNQYGAIVSSHDYQSSSTDPSPGRMPRVVAMRHALTLPAGPDLSTHIDSVFDELGDYELMTATFLNYYAPRGFGGVLVGHPAPVGDSDFYYLRRPQAAWHHGEALITTNQWTDGASTPSDEDFGADAYYDIETPKTQESHWNLLAASSGGNRNLHMLSVAYRGQENMTIWAEGRIAGSGRTPRIELEWSELFSHCPTLSLEPCSAELKLCETSVRLPVTAIANDPDGDILTLEWTAQPPVTFEGEGPEVVAIMSAAGDHEVTCTVMDGTHVVTADVLVRILACSELFRRGDCNDDGTVDISHPVAALGYLFLGTEDLGCLDAADADDSGAIDISDAVYSLTFLFLDGRAPEEPFPACGPDPTPDDDLTCESFEGCPKA